MFLQGQTPRVHMHWRRYSVEDIPLDNAEAFGAWLRGIYKEKDEMIGQFLQHGEFPGPDRDHSSKHYHDTTIRLNNWWEAFKIYFPW